MPLRHVSAYVEIGMQAERIIQALVPHQGHSFLTQDFEYVLNRRPLHAFGMEYQAQAPKDAMSGDWCRF
jgi:hypothetical protein